MIVFFFQKDSPLGIFRYHWSLMFTSYLVYFFVYLENGGKFKLKFGLCVYLENSHSSNSPNHITNPKYFTIDFPRVSDLVRFFEDRANLKTPSEICPPLPP